MFSIGEFSKITGLPVRTLRFYQEKGILIPAVVDEASGYRYYNTGNAEKARVVKVLRTLEFSLDEIATILREHDDEADILDHLERQKADLAAQVRSYQNTLAVLDHIIRTERDARQSATDKEFRVEEKMLDGVLAAGIRMRGKYSDCGGGFALLGRLVGRYVCGKPFCLYYDSDYHDDDADFETCVPVRKAVQADGMTVRELRGGRAVTLLHRGPYDSLGRSYARLLKHLRENQREVLLPTREVYVKGPGIIFPGKPQNYLTEIQLPVTE